MVTWRLCCEAADDCPGDITSDDSGEPVDDMVADVAWGLEKPTELHAHDGQFRGSWAGTSISEVDFRSQCLLENNGVSKKAEYRWILMRALESHS